MFNINTLAGALVGMAVCWLLLRVTIRVAPHIGLVDCPAAHKIDVRQTPLVGGIAMSIAFFFAVLLLDHGLTPYRFLFAGIMLLVLVGVLDDMRELPPEKRVWAQIAAALLMVAGGGVVLEDLGHLVALDWIFQTGYLAWPFTVFATVGVINALNMSDGLDGLAASMALIALGGVGVLAWWGNDDQVLSMLIVTGSVLVPFLALNLRRGRSALVYMGDAGSMFLGFLLAWFLVQVSQGEQRLMAPVTALWLFAVPLIDTVTTAVRRAFLGRSPFLGDRQHLHHLLLAAGLTRKQTLLVIILFAFGAAAVGLTGELAPLTEPLMFGAFVALFAIHFWITMRAWRTGQLLQWALKESP